MFKKNEQNKPIKKHKKKKLLNKKEFKRDSISFLVVHLKNFFIIFVLKTW